jgi:hypothetical protein
MRCCCASREPKRSAAAGSCGSPGPNWTIWRTSQAAADAVVAIIAKIGEFRGESRFTT